MEVYKLICQININRILYIGKFFRRTKKLSLYLLDINSFAKKSNTFVWVLYFILCP